MIFLNKVQKCILPTVYRKGFQKTSISDIVNEAGVAKGTFYLYFKDKLDIRYKLIAKKSAEVFKTCLSGTSKRGENH